MREAFARDLERAYAVERGVSEEEELGITAGCNMVSVPVVCCCFWICRVGLADLVEDELRNCGSCTKSCVQ